MKPLDFIATTRRLARGRGRKPRQTDLRRAVSTAYYAAFHCLARCCADTLIGTNPATRSRPAWKQTYRALQHANSKKRREDISMIKRFPNSIQEFASTFAEMQVKRHVADYDPTEKFYRSAVHIEIDRVEAAINEFQKTPIVDRRAFAAYVLLRHRRD